MPGAPLLVVGSLNQDLVVAVPRFPEPGETLTATALAHYCGGKGANQAFAAARLGGDVAMLGRVGDDAFGRAQIENLRSQGVATDSILPTPDHPTGTALIEVARSGENRIVVVPGANGALTPDDLQESKSLFESASFVLLQLEVPSPTVEAALQLSHELGVRVILDPAPAISLPDSWYERIDTLTPNLSELNTLTDQSLDEHSPLISITAAARPLCKRGTRCVIAKLGARGAVKVTLNEANSLPAPMVDVVDTTAAGDCFNAAFAVERARGQSDDDAMAYALQAASLSVTSPGAQASMPTRKSVTAMA